MWILRTGRLSAVGLAAIAVVIVGASGFFWSYFHRPSPANFITSIGYLEVAPPSDFYSPGTLNTVEKLGNGKLAVHPTCEVDADSLKNVTQENPTVAWQESFGASSSISAEINSIFSSLLSHSVSGKIKVSFHDVTILTMSDESLAKVRKKIIKDECEEAVVWNIKNGGTVCQTADAVRADLVYTISFQGDVAVDVQNRIKKQIAERLNFKADVQGGNEIVGRGLFFGVRFNPYGLILDNSVPTKCNFD